MILRKDNKDNKSYYDSIVDNKIDAIVQVTNYMSDVVKDIIIKKGVIDLYPDGADKDKAVENLEFAKRHLLCLIGEYDDLRNQISNDIEKYAGRLKNKYKVPCDSHERVETTYKVCIS